MSVLKGRQQNFVRGQGRERRTYTSTEFGEVGENTEFVDRKNGTVSDVGKSPGELALQGQTSVESSGKKGWNY